MRSAATAGIRRGSPSRTDAAHAAEAASDSESDAGGKDTAETATAPTDAPAATTRLLDKLDERDETIRAKDVTIERLHGELRDVTARASAAEAVAAAFFWFRQSFWRQAGEQVRGSCFSRSQTSFSVPHISQRIVVRGRSAASALAWSDGVVMSRTPGTEPDSTDGRRNIHTPACGEHRTPTLRGQSARL
jgi:hypothetical protein